VAVAPNNTEVDEGVIVDVVESMNANVVLVLDWNEGFNLIKGRVGEGVKVIKLPKSGGVGEAGGKEGAGGYFRGVSKIKDKTPTDDGAVSATPKAGPPYWTTRKWSDFTFLKVEVVSVGSSMLPMGQSEVKSNVNVREVEDAKVRAGGAKRPLRIENFLRTSEKAGAKRQQH